jgi:hypothetical protein
MPLLNQAQRASAGTFTVMAASLAVLGSWATPAFAQVGNAALAESLFREGKRLSGEHKFSEACPKFAESYKLDPGLGTLLNLATCHESEGKPASAWAEFSEAAARAKREGDNDRAQLAEEHVRALEPKLAHVSIGLAPGATVSGLIIKFDSRELSSAALGMQIPVDPGKHLLEASAPGKQSYSQTFDAPSVPTTLAVTIPVLQDTSSAAPAAAPLAAPAAQTAPVAASAPAAPLAPQSGASHTGVIASGVATGLFVVGTVVTGALYSSKRSDFNAANDSGDASRADKRSSAQTMGTVNLLFTGGTLVSAGFLIYFIASAGSHESPQAASARLHLEPVVSPNGAALLLRGSL